MAGRGPGWGPGPGRGPGLTPCPRRDRARRGRGAEQGRGPRDRAEPHRGGPGEPLARGTGPPGPPTHRQPPGNALPSPPLPDPGPAALPPAPRPRSRLAAVPRHRAPVPGPGRLGRHGGGGGQHGALRAAGEQRGRGRAAALPGGDAGGPAAVSASAEPWTDENRVSALQKSTSPVKDSSWCTGASHSRGQKGPNGPFPHGLSVVAAFPAAFSCFTPCNALALFQSLSSQNLPFHPGMVVHAHVQPTPGRRVSFAVDRAQSFQPSSNSVAAKLKGSCQ